MTPQELKNSILQLAIQGKLVEQRPEEGTAEELFARIQEEKQRLIAEKKIKKEKPLPEITEDEKPFEIPESWKWVRVQDISTITTGKKDANYGTSDGEYPFYTCAANPLKCPGYSFDCSAIILAGNGDFNNISLFSGKFEAYQRTYVVSPFKGLLDEYIYFVFKARWVKYNLNKIYGSAIPYIRLKNVQEYLIPIPPLAEQKRIVAKIEELLPYIDRYEQAWSKLEQFNSRFPEDMKKSLLQYAIQGKLVEQRPEEGTAEELFAQIREEKQRLIAEKKIKKEKPMPEISEDEKPFDIPDSWKWVRLGGLTELITSGSRDWAKYYSDTGDIFLRMGNLSRNSFDLRLDKIQRVALPENAEGTRTSLQAGDLLFSITGEVGTLGLIPDGFGTAYINQHTAMIRFLLCERNRFIPYLLLSDYAQKFYNGNQHGIKNSFRLDSIALLPVPLPPISEQKRIVAKLEQLLPLCERLK